ncbi:low molecular weight protein-tyrosine-phosphatase [Aquimarina hainanensis]|uniref:protein-tyrosine-phosphatase n=1 Tax=Aquimarina hainanensis TaxID=1578017 RepID=A0ABW5NHD5_9FLAO
MATKILMVCLGNICRSPLAEGILQSKLPPEEFIIDSCGTSSHHIGEKPDLRSIEIASVNHIDISNQRAAQLTKMHLDTYDIIYAMDQSNYDNILKLSSPDNKDKVKLILNESHPNKNLGVPDPYYGGTQGFEDVFNMLNDACDIIAHRLKK